MHSELMIRESNHQDGGQGIHWIMQKKLPSTPEMQQQKALICLGTIILPGA